ncbi:MAG: AsmA family protein, partial [Bacteroidales bacterium]|nr:AsmA family protein [Bacteroidales bacterium]
MKTRYKFMRISGLIILSFILFIIITVVVAKIYEDKLAAFTIEKLESEINAPMSIGEVSLIPLFSFPKLSAEINKLYIGDPQSQKSDTLFFINSLKLSLDTWDLMFGVYTIDKLEISGLDFEYIIDKQGKSNIDFLINAFANTTADSKEDTIATNLDLSAEKFKLEDIHIYYFDSLTNIGSQVRIPEITINASTKNNIYKGRTNGSFVLSHCQVEDTKLDQMESYKVSFNLKFENDEVIIKKLSINSEGIDLGMEGVFNNKDGYGLNAIIEANSLDFNILKKYILNENIEFIKDVKLAQIEPVSLDLNLLYKDNNIDIKKLLLQSKGIDLGFNGMLIQNDTLSIDANIESLKLDFNLLKKYVPEQFLKQYGIIDIGGILDVTAKIAGQYTDSNLLPMVDANVNFKNMRMQTVDYPQIDTFNLSAHITTDERPDMSKASIYITNGEIISSSSSIQLEGTVVGIENPKYNLSSNLDINLAEFESFIPDSLAKNLEGNITAVIGTSGTLPENMDNLLDYLMDHSTISLDFKEVSAMLIDSLKVHGFSTQINYLPQKSNEKEIQIEKLKLKSEALSVNLHHTSLLASIRGKVSDPLHIGIKLKSFNIQNGSSRIAGSGEINNFETPEFNIKTSIDLKLQEFLSFVPDSLIKSMSGTLEANIESQGKINIDSIESQFLPILFENSSFDLKLNNIAFAFPDSIMDIDSISAHISLENDLLNINYFSLDYNGLKFEMDSSKIRNLYKAVLLNQEDELYVHTDIKFGDMLFEDFKHLLAKSEKDTKVETTAITDNSTYDTTTEEHRNWTY